MFNLLKFVNDNNLFQQFKINDLLFVEYHCVADEPLLEVWSKHNYFFYVLRGQKTWQTTKANYCVKAGEAIFVKKGANFVHQYFEQGFCSLIIFVPDHFISNIIKENPIPSPLCKKVTTDTVFRLKLDSVLSLYFQSLLAFFAQKKKPSGNLLEIKFKELILNLISSSNNELLCGHFQSLCDGRKTSIREVMESNFIYNMKLEEFAYLSGRSLSSFKRDFINTYNCTPGKWLLKKRLEYAKYLLEVTDKNINELAFESGFENASHFIKVFRETYQLPPLRYKKLNQLFQLH